MLHTMIAFFALAAIFGTALLSYVLRGKQTAKGIVITHGVFAVSALLMLLYYTFSNTPGPAESAVLFVVAATGGITMVTRDIRGKPIPKWLAIAHGTIAITGFVLLLIFAFKK